MYYKKSDVGRRVWNCDNGWGIITDVQGKMENDKDDKVSFLEIIDVKHDSGLIETYPYRHKGQNLFSNLLFWDHISFVIPERKEKKIKKTFWYGRDNRLNCHDVLQNTSFFPDYERIKDCGYPIIEKIELEIDENEIDIEL